MKGFHTCQWFSVTAVQNQSKRMTWQMTANPTSSWELFPSPPPCIRLRRRQTKTSKVSSRHQTMTGASLSSSFWPIFSMRTRWLERLTRRLTLSKGSWTTAGRRSLQPALRGTMGRRQEFNLQPQSSTFENKWNCKCHKTDLCSHINHHKYS